jgi:dienelactone hydrolase
VWLARREISARSIGTVGFAFGGLQVFKVCANHPGLIRDALMRFNPLNRSISDIAMVP